MIPEDDPDNIIEKDLRSRITIYQEVQKSSFVEAETRILWFYIKGRILIYGRAASESWGCGNHPRG